MGARLATFLGDLTGALKDGDGIEIAFGYHLDGELVEAAVMDSGARHWESIRRRLRPVNVHSIASFGAGALAAETYFKSQGQATLARHHALCDARALRVACEAAREGGPNTSRLVTPAAR